MISDTTMRNTILKLTHDWFHGVISGAEYDNAMAALSLGQNFPNPCSDYTSIPIVNLKNNATLEVLDISGRILFTQSVETGTETVKLNTENLESGMYFYKLISKNMQVDCKPFQIIK